ncbi:MAG: CPBP family intramembrane glutamic endopeptidase [Cyanobacteria bacterium J06597_16]
MSKRFLSNVYEGHNGWWRYCFVISSVIVFWGVFAYVLTARSENFLSRLSVHTLVSEMVSGALPFLVVIIWLAIAIKGLHRRSFRSLINAEAGIHYRRMGQGFVVWTMLMATWTGIDICCSPHRYQWAFDPSSWFWLLPLSVALVPIKTSAEELLFRGYLMQGVRLFTKRPLFLLLISGIVFALPHFNNPEMSRGSFLIGALNYFFWGVIFAAMTLKDNGLELSLGVHAANNLFSYLMVATPDSVVVTPALWTYNAPIDPIMSLVGLLVSGAIFYAIFFSRLRRRTHVSHSSS